MKTNLLKIQEKASFYIHTIDDYVNYLENSIIAVIKNYNNTL